MYHENKVINAAIYLIVRISLIAIGVGAFLTMTHSFKGLLLTFAIIVLIIDALHWFREKSYAKEAPKSSA